MAGIGLAGGLPYEVASAWSPYAGFLAGLATTALLLLLYSIAQGNPRLAPAAGALAIFASLSVFGWFGTVVTAIPAVADWLATAPVPLAFLVVNATKFGSVVPAAVVAYKRGWTRDELNLRIGNLNARAVGPLRWPVVGPAVIVVVLALFLVGTHGYETVVPWVPVILLGTVLNAAAEEFLYRHTAIRALTDAMGVAGAVALTSVVFGLAHLTGNPGGWTGVLFTTAFGLICALAMVRTRGFGWNLLIHVCGDIGVVLALSLTTQR
ncbi:hypothetical protein GCM10009765_14970 [Fodinicola feengrottensis]|uniref:CAAX prenyl protease 2/Lysostaphin resistance protein A-like domain-containing protein n=1 Tax=Fodinicola feengrottensis TaxID=435914 RepID=A0ABN2G8F3_9ACTN